MDDSNDDSDPDGIENRQLLRRVDAYLDGMDRLLSSIEADIAEGGLGPHYEWDARSPSSRARLLAEQLGHIAHEMDMDDRFISDENDDYDSPFGE